MLRTTTLHRVGLPRGLVVPAAVKHGSLVFLAKVLNSQLPAENNWPLRNRASRSRLIQRASNDDVQRQIWKNQGVTRIHVEEVRDWEAECRLALASCCNIRQGGKASSICPSIWFAFIEARIPLWKWQTERAR